jgi:hypothetical protein
MDHYLWATGSKNPTAETAGLDFQGEGWQIWLAEHRSGSPGETLGGSFLFGAVRSSFLFTSGSVFGVRPAAIKRLQLCFRIFFQPGRKAGRLTAVNFERQAARGALQLCQRLALI